MATEIVMPKMGATMEEGTIVNWIVEVGERVEEGDPIVEVLTDKITMEIEAEFDGVLLKTLYEVDDVVKVFEVIAYIGEEGEEIGSDSSSIQTSQQEDNLVGKIRRTPAARKLAEDNGITLQFIKGSGPQGRIHKIDVADYMNEPSQVAKVTPLAKKTAHINQINLTQVKGTGIQGKVVQDDVFTQMDTKEKGQKKPFTGMRKMIAERLAKSAFTAPHVTLTSEIDMTEVIIMRKHLLPLIEEQNGYRISFNEIILKAVAYTLKKHPAINLSLQDNEIIYHTEINIGFAVAVPNGLVVPVVKNTNHKGLAEITEECKKLGLLARDGKLLPDNMTGGTFTVSNLGMFAVDVFTPIINQPESAILGVGRIVEKPVGLNGEIKLRSMMTLSLSFDHRIIDGAPAAQFLTDLKEVLETPYKLMI